MLNRLKKILKEPIVLFVVMGLVLFIGYTWFSQQFDRRDRRIVVNPAQIELMAMTFEKTWNRPPTEAELEAQVENYIMDEVFFKEAVSMGLDKSDPAVKRRLRTLMEMMMDELSAVYPSEEQLSTYLQENADKFRADPVISFEHIYFAERDRAVAEQQRDKLNNDLPPDEQTFGNMSMIPRSFEEESYFQINRTLGDEFAQQVFEVTPGRWEGPVHSAYGWHLIYASKITPGYVPELADIWDEVEREWSVERKREKKSEQYQKMKDKYDVRFEAAN